MELVIVELEQLFPTYCVTMALHTTLLHPLIYIFECTTYKYIYSLGPYPEKLGMEMSRPTFFSTKCHISREMNEVDFIKL